MMQRQPDPSDPGARPPGSSGARIAIVGTRGLPAAYGGFETFAAQVAPLLVERHGLSVTVIGDASCTEGNFHGVRSVQSRYSKARNAVRFYWDSLRIAREVSDLALVCGTPGGGLAWRVRRDLVVATNPDGLEARRTKWSRPVQALFFASERLSTWFTHAIVCDSPAIQTYYQKTHRARRTFVAEYGALPNPFLRSGSRSGELEERLATEGLTPRGYHLLIARIEPENQIHLAIEAVRLRAKEERLPLLVVGDFDLSPYGEKLAQDLPAGVRLLGSIYDTDRLLALRAGARSYVHGHTVGGTNPSLLEAMAAGNACICHENVFNRNTTDGQAAFFSNAESLANHLRWLEGDAPELDLMRDAALKRWSEQYRWEQIAEKYARIFNQLLSSSGSLS